MGTWGTGLYQNDTAKDIKADFNELLKKGKSIQEAQEKIISSYRELKGTDEEGLLWIILADLEWEYGLLESQTLEKAKRWIDSGIFEEEWKEASEKDYIKWKSNLEELKNKFEKPNEKPKKIRKYRLFKCKLIRGGVYAYQISSPYLEGTDYFGKYIVFVKVAETDDYPGHIVPVVKVIDGIWDEVPGLDQINQKNYLPLNECIDEMCTHPEYILGISASSERNIPYKKFVFLGMKESSYEGIDPFSPFFSPLLRSKSYCNMVCWSWKYRYDLDFDVYITLRYAYYHGLGHPHKRSE